MEQAAQEAVRSPAREDFGPNWIKPRATWFDLRAVLALSEQEVGLDTSSAPFQPELSHQPRTFGIFSEDQERTRPFVQAGTPALIPGSPDNSSPLYFYPALCQAGHYGSAEFSSSIRTSGI